MFFIHLFITSMVFVPGCLSDGRVYFSGCGKAGFTCFNNKQDSKKSDLIYQCPAGAKDIKFYINQFSAPSNIFSLTITNCTNITISTRCSGDNRPIQELTVSNIGVLTFQRLQYEPMLPPLVIFRNISNILSIPTKTFGQIDKIFYTAGCYVQPRDFNSLYFINVNIDEVQSEAFVGLNHFKNFAFINVSIKRIQTSGIKLKHDLDGHFEMKNCTINDVEYLGLQIYGKRAVIVENHFTDISSSGINGSMQEFSFAHNHIGILQPHAFSILATNILMRHNEYLHLKSHALEKLSPGLLQDSGMNFGKLKFKYDFSNNKLHYIEPLSLHPDYASYENVQTEMTFSRNNVSCYCNNVGWLFSKLSLGNYGDFLEPFYAMVLDEEYRNVCDGCQVPLERAKQLIKCGQCVTGMDIGDLCMKMEKTEQVTQESITTDVTVVDDFSVMIPADYVRSDAALIGVSCVLTYYIFVVNLFDGLFYN